MAVVVVGMDRMAIVWKACACLLWFCMRSDAWMNPYLVWMQYCLILVGSNDRHGMGVVGLDRVQHCIPALSVPVTVALSKKTKRPVTVQVDKAQQSTWLVQYYLIQ
eukprot:scaffold259757_cov20-Tisochrysis_lutea.AAC.1